MSHEADVKAFETCVATDPEINELEKLVAVDTGEGTYDASATRAAAILDRIAATLRDPKQREPLGGTTLIASITRVVKSQVKAADRSEAYLGLVGQAGRVAANLSADCDLNRTRLAEAGYVSAVFALLATRPILPLPALRPIVASILNLLVSRHEACMSALSAADLRTVIALAVEIYTPGTYTGDSGVAGWLWTIADSIVPSENAPKETLGLNDAQALLPPLAAFAERPKPVCDVDGSEYVSADLLILAHATAILDRFNTADKIDHAAIMADKTTMEAMLDFVEDAVLPPWAEFEDDDDDEEEEGEKKEEKEPGHEQEKSLGIGKAAVARTIVSLLAEAQAPEWVWSRVSAWMEKKDRPDLVSCALLSYGNKARSDAAATALLPKVLDHLLPLMHPTSAVLVQHALIGLLRNLSIPEANKAPLGEAGVIEKLVGMAPWAETRDVLGSIQGGAVGVVKNLVREPSNAARFLATPGVAAVHALIKRTSDNAIAMEGCRVWVNAVRALAGKPPRSQTAWDTLCSEAVVKDLCGMLSRGESYLVLVNEGVLALALLVAYGRMGEAVERALMLDPNAGLDAIADVDAEDAADSDGPAQKARSAAHVLAGILAPTPARPVGAEAQANALALVTVLPLGQVRGVVRAEVKAAQEEGRSVAVGVEMLDLAPGQIA